VAKLGVQQDGTERARAQRGEAGAPPAARPGWRIRVGVRAEEIPGRAAHPPTRASEHQRDPVERGT
jgi:hypothetical protein